MATKRRLILETLKTRLETIGVPVYLNEIPMSGDSDSLPPVPPVLIAMLVRPDEEVWRRGRKRQVRLPIEIQAIARADLDAPWLAAEDTLGDIQEAIEQDDWTLGDLLASELEPGSKVVLERESGSEFVGAAITYVAPYVERWGHPED